MKPDLHCHSNCSDGSLTPLELVERAHQQGVTHLAITDHDTVAAHYELANTPLPLTLISGIEFSTSWRGRSIHIVGLGLDLNSPELLEGVASQRAARLKRAELIAERLSKKGIPCDFAKVQQLAGDAEVGRPHFAQYLVEQAKVKNQAEAFKKYLGAGKIGDVKQHWACMTTVIEWIRAAGGVATLAHPLKYKLTRTKLKELLIDFKAAGGESMEAVSGKQIPADTRDMAELCRDFGLYASMGSDFHHPGANWSELGNYSVLPDGYDTVLEAIGVAVSGAKSGSI